VKASHLRDLQLGAQLDVPVSKSVAGHIGNWLLSFSAKYQHVPDDVLADFATVVAAGAVLRGNLFAGQGKLTIPVKGSGVKIPISFTVSNRTELIKETDIRGNIGVTFDLDTIVGFLKPAK
jgi:hypothetical protein